ncbi:MAG: hypothetical protein HY216_04100 [Candidatus Rokubacteria bacterium]|nr:hypothetical protein [Candidatus Rokubacteria bacterium]
MKPLTHVVLGGAAAGALAPAIGLESACAFWGASVLIDVDHHWDYVYWNGFRDWSVTRAFAFHLALFPLRRRPDFLALSVLHTVEAFLLVALGWWAGLPFAGAVFLGMLFHLGLDLLHLAGLGLLFKRALSIVEFLIRRRRLRRAGLDPDAPYLAACRAIGAPGRVPRATRHRAADVEPVS